MTELDLSVLNQLSDDEIADIIAEEMGEAGGDNITRYPEMTPENQAKFRAEAENITKLNSEMIPVKQEINSLDTEANIVKGVGNAALETAGSITGGALAAGTGGLGAGVGATVGDYVGRGISKTLGFRDDIGVSDLAKINPTKLETYTENPATLNMVLPGSVWLMKNARKAYRSVFPNVNLTQYLEDIQKGSAAAYLGGAGKTSIRESQITREAKKLEEAFLDANPMKGISPDDPQAIETLITNMKNIKKQAKADKLAMLRAADGKLPPNKQGIQFDIYNQKFKNPSTAKILDDEISYVERELVDNSSLAGQFFEKNGKQLPLKKSGLNGEDSVTLIQRLDDKIKALGGYDDLKLASKSTDPSFFAKNQELKALKEARSYVNKKLLERAPNIEPLNERIAAMVEYGNIAERRTLQLLEKISPKTGKSLVKNLDTGSSKGSIIEAASGGKIAQINENRRRAESAMEVSEDIKKLQGIAPNRASGMPKPGMLEGAMQSIGDIDPTKLIAAGQAARQVPDAANTAFEQLPRTTEEWAGMVMSEAQAMEFDPNTLAQAQKAFASGTPEEAKRGVAMLASQRPDLFAPSQVPGMNSMVDGVIYDDLEKQAATQKIDSIFEHDTAKRLKAKEAILDGKPLEPYAIEALGGQPDREQSFEDQFLTQEEGGQKLEAYYPKVKGSGVTVGTGVDLGNRSVDELRDLGIPEDLVVRLSPYLGKKDERAAQAIKNNPLILTPEEATLLDQKVKGQIKSEVNEKFKKTSGLNVDDLPEEARTVIYSLAYNFGANLESKIPTLWKHIVAGDWGSLQEALRKTKWKQPELVERRQREAALLEPLIPRIPGEPEFNLRNTQLAKIVGDEEGLV